jgi:hypothetical protein
MIKQFAKGGKLLTYRGTVDIRPPKYPLSINTFWTLISTANFRCGHEGSKREAVFSVYHQTFQQVNNQSEKANIPPLLPPTNHQLVHKSTISYCVDHAPCSEQSICSMLYALPSITFDPLLQKWPTRALSLSVGLSLCNCT